MARTTTGALAGANLLLDRGMQEQLRLCWRLLRDDRVSVLKYAVPALLTFYLLLPIDAVPDFLLGVGQVDDIGVVIVMVMLLTRLIPWLAPKAVVEEHLREMGAASSPGTARASGDVVDAEFEVRG